MPKLFIVDDEPSFEEAIKPFFELKGFTVFTAQSGEEALPKIEIEKPDVILLDMHLKGKLDGLGILKEIKEKSLSAKIIMLTGMENDVKDEALKIGADKFLTKPVTVKVLYESVAEVLAQDK